MKLKFFLSTTLILGVILNSLAQDTITLYLDTDFNSTEIENASFIRRVVIANNHYYVTDNDINGKPISYGEYKSVNPWIEDGLSKHYDNDGNKYSMGRYLNGELVGNWIYFTNETVDTVNYNLDLSKFQTYDCNAKKVVKNKKKLQKLGKVHVDSIIDLINRNFHYPARTKSQIKNFTQVLELTIDVDGKVKCPRIVNYIDKDLSTELFRILLKYNSKIEVIDPIPLSINITINEEQNDKDEDIFTIVENMPRFNYLDCNSTLECLAQFISDSIRNPSANCSGRVIVNFVVEPDGSVSNLQILKGIDGCNGYLEEIERLFMVMPAWISGKQRGVAVRVRQNASINFN